MRPIIIHAEFPECKGINIHFLPLLTLALIMKKIVSTQKQILAEKAWILQTNELFIEICRRLKLFI